jgi:hypothetical protein
MPPEPT